ncbi:MAG TPA: class I SAM-dependent methyltransferase [Bryobacteraceae bacterium]|nr:class I SAM-dependent methyltransferase [Bryobacteraceae bacterium]
MDEKAEELTAMIAEIRERVRARHPNGSAPGQTPLPDLMPLLHARDAADAKVAAIGTVNPRGGGVANSLIQSVKRLIARALDWHVREQVEFNRAVMNCVQATLESLGETNRGLAILSARIAEASTRAELQAVREETSSLRAEARELKDIRLRWSEWHVHWEKTLADAEIHFLRSVSELQAAFNYRVTVTESGHRDDIKAQHANFEAALARTTEDIQKRLWEDLARVRTEYETLIHTELRVLRQKFAAAKPIEAPLVSAPSESLAPARFDSVDWLRFADRFRGSESNIRERQQLYAGKLRDASRVLDIGCGRGELLEVLRDAGVAARGIDLSAECVAVCRSKGLDAEQADLFTFLAALDDSSLGGLVCCQVAEHLAPERLPELIRLAHAKLKKGALIAIETPNPECLAIFVSHFYIDPTHRHPIPLALLSFYLEEAGFGNIEIARFAPAIESMSSLAELPDGFRKDFFGALDYAAFGVKLS